MSFTTLPWAAVLAGLAGLAAGLFALQQLRTRYRDVTVVTTLFWKQVIDEAPVRKLRDRFRHPLAYALILAICSLIWIAFADPQFAAASDDTFHVLVLDGSAGMAAGNRYRAAVADLERQVVRLPADRRQVIWSGAELRPLLAPGEHALLLRKRLEQLAPEAAPASVERLLRQLSASSRGTGKMSVVVFGDAPVRRQVLDLMPASITVGRSAQPAALAGNAGITSLGVSDAASGAWDRVDVLVDVQTTDGGVSLVSDVRMGLNGQPVPSSGMTRAARPNGYAFVVRDLPADGGLFTVRLGAPDTLPLDDTASLRLPNKRILNILLSASLDPVLGPVLKADPGVTMVSSSPDVVIRLSGETVGGDAPALEFVQASAQQPAFLLTHPASLESDVVLADAVEEIGLRQIDAMSLAQDAGRPIEISIAQGTQWRFSVRRDLLSEHYNFTRSRAFPLFVANAVRWLAGTPVWYSSVAVGRPMVAVSAGNGDRIVDAAGRAIDPLGVAFVPPRAGDLRLATGNRTLPASLLDPDVTRGARDAALEVVPLAPVTASPDSDASTWLLIVAVILLAVEWHLFQRGRLP